MNIAPSVSRPRNDDFKYSTPTTPHLTHKTYTWLSPFHVQYYGEQVHDEDYYFYNDLTRPVND